VNLINGRNTEYFNKNGGKQHEKAPGSRMKLSCMLGDVYIYNFKSIATGDMK
jgi:hypothetical protein